jgi:hypothetical protein
VDRTGDRCGSYRIVQIDPRQQRLVAVDRMRARDFGLHSINRIGTGAAHGVWTSLRSKKVAAGPQVLARMASAFSLRGAPLLDRSI